MIRKLWFYFLALVLAGAAVAAVVAAVNSTKSRGDDSTNSATEPIKKTPAVKEACATFSLADAKVLLGDTAKGGENPAIDSSGDLKVTTCTYTQDQGANAPVSGRNSATLLVRAPLTEKGKNSNQGEFGPLKPSAVQDVEGYGDKAYWDAEHGQLNILKDGIWYVLSYGPITPGERTLDQARQMADILINKL